MRRTPGSVSPDNHNEIKSGKKGRTIFGILALLRFFGLSSLNRRLIWLEPLPLLQDSHRPGYSLSSAN